MSDDVTDSPLPDNSNTALVHQADTPPDHIEELAHEVLELKLAALQEKSTYQESVEQLRSRLRQLRASLVFVFFLFGGVVTWQAIQLRQQADQLSQVQQLLPTLSGQPEDLQQLADQLSAVQEQVSDDLSRSLEQTQEDVLELQENLESLDQEVGDRQQALIILTQALQALVGEDPSAEADTLPQASTEESPDNATEEDDEEPDDDASNEPGATADENEADN